MSTEAATLIDQAIEQHVVFAATKSWCPHSRKAKDLLASLSVEAKIIDIDLLDNAEAVQEYLKEKSGGQKTVPNIWVKQKHIGGNSDLQNLHASGELAKMLQ